MVRKGGLEPPCLTAPPPQDGVSANSTTSAFVALMLSRPATYCNAAKWRSRFITHQGIEWFCDRGIEKVGRMADDIARCA